jgi:hypothetical protein
MNITLSLDQVNVLGSRGNMVDSLFHIHELEALQKEKKEKEAHLTGDHTNIVERITEAPRCEYC